MLLWAVISKMLCVMLLWTVMISNVLRYALMDFVISTSKSFSWLNDCFTETVVKMDYIDLYEKARQF